MDQVSDWIHSAAVSSQHRRATPQTRDLSPRRSSPSLPRFPAGAGLPEVAQPDLVGGVPTSATFDNAIAAQPAWWFCRRPWRARRTPPGPGEGPLQASLRKGWKLNLLNDGPSDYPRVRLEQPSEAGVLI